MGNKI